jgi:hypothetical protein
MAQIQISPTNLFALKPLMTAPNRELLRHPDFWQYSFLTEADASLFLTRLVIHLEVCAASVFLVERDLDVDFILQTSCDAGRQELITRLRKLCYDFYIRFEENYQNWTCRAVIDCGGGAKLNFSVLTVNNECLETLQGIAHQQGPPVCSPK